MRRAIMPAKPRRSTCPINFAVETFGDRWSLLIIRDIAFFGKRTFGEFAASQERIASNILASRLAHLEDEGIIAKSPDPADRRTQRYSLTDKGLDLLPILLEMANWSATHDAKTTAPLDFVARVNADKERAFALIRRTVAEGSSVLAGENSAARRLAEEGVAGYELRDRSDRIQVTRHRS
jgi:DNA-binding HxlR family transcriptional regulator